MSRNKREGRFLGVYKGKAYRMLFKPLGGRRQCIPVRSYWAKVTSMYRMDSNSEE